MEPFLTLNSQLFRIFACNLNLQKQLDNHESANHNEDLSHWS